MYPNYPWDQEAQMEDTARRAIEGDQSHVYLSSGSVTIPCTANTLASQAVTFAKPYTPNTVPDVVVGIKSVGTLTSTVKFVTANNATNTGFTIQTLTDTTQTIVVTWIAKGKAE